MTGVADRGSHVPRTPGFEAEIGWEAGTSDRRGASESSRAAERVVAFIDHVLPPPRDFVVRLWNGTEIGGEDGRRFTVVLNGPGAARKAFAVPVELALGEAFIFNDLDIEGDLSAALTLKNRVRAALASPRRILEMLYLRSRLPKDSSRIEGRGPAALSGALHSRERDRAAIQYHYDVGNDFFAQWLDERMVYTCAYFPTGTEDLDTAQLRKLDYICRKLRLQPGERLLDIGSGWGGLCVYAAQQYGVRAVGVTLSRQQYDHATSIARAHGIDDRVEFRLQDYRDIQETFDKIVSIGMFEAVGPNYTEYFTTVFTLLQPGGLFLNHSIAANARAGAWINRSWVNRRLRRAILGTGLIRERYIFPDGELIPVSEANLVAERTGFEVRDVENLREHYEMTLRTWLSRLDARRQAAIRVAGEVVYRTWRLYMTAAMLEFASGNINVNQTLFARPANGRQPLPLSRAYLYEDGR